MDDLEELFFVLIALMTCLDSIFSENVLKRYVLSLSQRFGLARILYLQFLGCESFALLAAALAELLC